MNKYLDDAINQMRADGQNSTAILKALADAGTLVHEARQDSLILVALVDKDGAVLSITQVYDDWTGAEGEWQPPEGLTAVSPTEKTGPAAVGGQWNGTTFEAPPPPPEPELSEREKALAKLADAAVKRGEITEEEAEAIIQS